MILLLVHECYSKVYSFLPDLLHILINSNFFPTNLVCKFNFVNSRPVSFITFLIFTLQLMFFDSELFLMLSGDVEINAEPYDWQYSSFCHWNLNSIPAHNFVKLDLLEVYNSIHKFDIIYLSET